MLRDHKLERRRGKKKAVCSHRKAKITCAGVTAKEEEEGRREGAGERRRSGVTRRERRRRGPTNARLRNSPC